MSQTGEPTPDYFLHAFDLPPRMVADLRAVSQVPQTLIGAVATVLSEQTGFLTAGRLEAVVARAIPDGKQAAAVANTVFSVPPERVEPLLSTLRIWREKREEYKQAFTDTILGDLAARLKVLCITYPALDRFKKAERLGQITGDRCDTIDLLCDLRPVFDPSRETVEGLVPLITLRIAFTDQDRGDGTAEYQLSEDTLGELEEKVALARQKLATLSRAVQGWLPDGWLGNETSSE